MPLDPLTTEVMRRLPAALRPNPWNLEEAVMTLVSRGWVPADIFSAIMADKPREPGHVIAAARRLSDQPAPATGEGWKYGHELCTNPTHDNCQICRCHHGIVSHITPVPMPAWFREQWTKLFAGWGTIPSE